jgi:hypothetical protein
VFGGSASVSLAVLNSASEEKTAGETPVVRNPEKINIR